MYPKHPTSCLNVRLSQHSHFQGTTMERFVPGHFFACIAAVPRHILRTERWFLCNHLTEQDSNIKPRQRLTQLIPAWLQTEGRETECQMQAKEKKTSCVRAVCVVPNWMTTLLLMPIYDMPSTWQACVHYDSVKHVYLTYTCEPMKWNIGGLKDPEEYVLSCCIIVGCVLTNQNFSSQCMPFWLDELVHFVEITAVITMSP